MIGEGEKPSVAVEKVGMVVEGMFTAQAALSAGPESRRGDADHRVHLQLHQREDHCQGGGGASPWAETGKMKNISDSTLCTMAGGTAVFPAVFTGV